MSDKKKIANQAAPSDQQLNRRVTFRISEEQLAQIRAEAKSNPAYENSDGAVVRAALDSFFQVGQSTAKGASQ